MDQESFRKLLQTPSASSGKPTVSSSKGSSSKTKSKKGDASQPAFKPRTVKKPSTSSYRDRAAERRHGVAGDFAQIEALAEDFDRRNAENEDRKAVEEQRKYLGGDSDHSVLVKGLDFSLLEQNKARVAATSNVEDDESLEQAFLEASSSVPKKRTREDIVKELKNKRQKSEGAEAERSVSVEKDVRLEEAKKAGKFKPIGFKPIGASGKDGEKKKKKVKKVKAGENGIVKKKRNANEGVEVKQDESSIPSAPAMKQPKAGPSSEPEPEPVDEEFDIFAGAGEYAGVDLGSDSEDEDEQSEDEQRGRSEQDDVPPLQKGKWVDTEGQQRALLSHSPRPYSKTKSRSPASSSPHRPGREDGELAECEAREEGEEEAPMRLVPLSSSAVPSIRDILAMDEEAQKLQKRKARKEKRKAGLSAEGKVDRDYQRLKSYTEKKTAGGSKHS